MMWNPDTETGKKSIVENGFSSTILNNEKKKFRVNSSWPPHEISGPGPKIISGPLIMG